MHGDAFAARDVADNAFAANRIATARAVDQHVALPADRDGVVIAEDAAHHAGDAARLRGQTLDSMSPAMECVAPAGSKRASTWRAEYFP